MGEKEKFLVLVKNVGTEIRVAKDFWKEAEAVFGEKMTSGNRSYIIRKLKESGQLEVAGTRRGTMYSIKETSHAIKYFMEQFKEDSERHARRRKLDVPKVAEKPAVSAPLSEEKQKRMKYLENVLRMLRFCVRQKSPFIPGEDVARITKHSFVKREHVVGWFNNAIALGLDIALPVMYKEAGKATKYEFKNYKRDLVIVCDEGHKLFPDNDLFDAVKAFGESGSEAIVGKIRREIAMSHDKAPKKEEVKPRRTKKEKAVAVAPEVKDTSLDSTKPAPSLEEKVPIKIQDLTLNDLLAILGKLKVQITISM